MNQSSNVLRRFYFLKRSGMDTAESLLKQEVKDFLRVEVDQVKALTRFDIEFIAAEEEMLQIRDVNDEHLARILSDPVQDIRIPMLENGAPDLSSADINSGDYELIVELVPGQYDQRADLTAQNIQISFELDLPLVKSATHYIFYGIFSEEDKAKIKKWLINPVESRESTIDLPETLIPQIEEPTNIPIHEGFTKLSGEVLEEYIADQQLAMSLSDLFFIQSYFRDIKRDPTETEIKVLDTYWSDHCRHTTFNTSLNNVCFPQNFNDKNFEEHLSASWQRYLDWHKTFELENNNTKPITLMDLATISTKILKRNPGLNDLDESEEINACSIKVPVKHQGKDREVLLMFKNETHNHPTEIEPFGGAATCLGGAIRDPLSGRAYAYQAMRVTGGGDPRQAHDNTRAGKLPQRQIAKLASLGYSSYGNQIGISAGQVVEHYHPGFEAKRLEAGAVMAAVPSEQVKRSRPQAGDVVLLVGGKTGRDGIGGATGSSVTHDKQSHENSAAEVQKGNPPLERNLQRLFRRPELSVLIKRCNDFGAGGVSVAIGELADGVEINLDAVPVKYPGLNGTEIALSESQERMAVVVEQKNVGKFRQLAAEENLEATAVAIVTAEAKLKINWRGQTIVALDRSFLDTNGAEQSANAAFTPSDAAAWFDSSAPSNDYLSDTDIDSPLKAEDSIASGKSIQNSVAADYNDDSGSDFRIRLLKSLGDLSQCSRKGLIERFDSTIGSGNLLPSLGGFNQLTPEMGMASLIPVAPGELSETASLMSTGYDPHLAEASPYHGAYFAVLSSLSKIAAMGGDPFTARLSFQEYFGKTSDEISWGKPLTALLGALDACLAFQTPSIGGKDSMSGTYEDLDVPPSLISFAVATAPAENVVSATLNRIDEKVYAFIVPLDQAYIPQAQLWLRSLRFISGQTKAGRVRHASVADSGGIAVAVTKSLLGEALGFNFSPELRLDLFSPAPGSLLVSFDNSVAEDDIKNAGGVLLGVTTEEQKVNLGKESIGLEEILECWIEPLAEVYPLSKTKVKAINYLSTATAPKNAETDYPHISLAEKRKPRVFIPILPGTNSEDDLIHPFREAGSEIDTLVFRNYNNTALIESRQSLIEHLNKAQILVFPGAAHGLAKAVFSQPMIAEAVNLWLEIGQNLILGTGNGFSELLQLGLLPGGTIVDTDPGNPTLATNIRGGFIGSTVSTRYMNASSPWLNLLIPDQIDRIPIAGEKGRLVASIETFSNLMDNGLIAFCYADPEGEPTSKEHWNPTGSTMGIEGMINKSGRILGKFGFSERYRHIVSQNFSHFTEQLICKSAVKWLMT
ncbi:MAG TPA: phosphoribosylformylglycinamidine synthase [Clostridiaceae bacterium]|nr:phosphoribosylformylglycinamidine synthase [Clostridiaceae bacterium]